MTTTNPQRIILLCHDFALAALPLLTLKRQSHNVIAVWGSDSQPTDPTFTRVQYEALLEAKQLKIVPTPGGVMLDSVPVKNIATLCHELQIPYKGITPLFATPAGMAIKNLDVDCVVSVGLDAMPPHNMVDEESKPWINLHLGHLPDGAGLDPTFWELAQGRDSGGICVHRVGQELWDGELLASEEVAFDNNQRYEAILERKLEAGAKLLAQALGKAPTDSTQLKCDTPLEQPSEANFSIDPNMSCQQIARFVSSLCNRHPLTFSADDAAFSIEGVASVDMNNQSGEPGDFETPAHERLTLRCQDGWITLVATKAEPRPLPE